MVQLTHDADFMDRRSEVIDMEKRAAFVVSSASSADNFVAVRRAWSMLFVGTNLGYVEDSFIADIDLRFAEVTMAWLIFSHSLPA